MWLIKRAVVDGWELNRALEEATLMGLTNNAMRQFAIAEIEKRKPANR